MTAQHIVSLSGGKDSLATALKAKERGKPFRVVFADTGNEDQITLDYVDSLEGYLGVPVETVRADFTAAFALRREQLHKFWSRPGRVGSDGQPTPAVPDALIERAIACLIPSGIPFLDLCMLKGRFPGVKSRFCTEDLKLRPMDEQIKLPLLNAGQSIVEWIGERAEESPARAAKPRLERLRWEFDSVTGARLARPASRVLHRPIQHLKVAEVFAIAKRHGVPSNPLYRLGMNRLGCMPCIMAKKGELRQIARRFPEHIARIEEWERIVQSVSRRQNATFFAAKMVPGEGDTRANIRSAVDWSNTGRGGWNYDIEHSLADQDAPAICESSYGLCE